MTETATLPDFVGSIVDVAKTKRVLAVSPPATVRRPLALMEVPAVTPPVPAAFELTFQVTVVSGSFVPETTALNCKVLPVPTV